MTKINKEKAHAGSCICVTAGDLGKSLQLTSEILRTYVVITAEGQNTTRQIPRCGRKVRVVSISGWENRLVEWFSRRAEALKTGGWLADEPIQGW